MRVRLLCTAERDLEDGFHFYESQSQDLGIYFLDSLFAEIDSLAFFGGIHPKFLDITAFSPNASHSPFTIESSKKRSWFSLFSIAVATQVGQELA